MGGEGASLWWGRNGKASVGRGLCCDRGVARRIPILQISPDRVVPLSCVAPAPARHREAG